MRIKFVFLILAALLATVTFFAFDVIADSESASDESIALLVGILLPLGIGIIICLVMILSRKDRRFLKTHRDQLSSEDPKVLLELSEKCEEYLKDQQSSEVLQLLKQANLAVFKSEISEDGSHSRVVSTFKEHMHNPDSFQHVSSEYEDIEKDGKHYYKITMVCRGTNTFGALVLQTYFFVLDEDNQISLIGSSDNTEASSVNTEKVSASVDAAVGVVEGVTLAADLLSFFSSNE